MEGGREKFLCIQMELCKENLEERFKAKRIEFKSLPKSSWEIQTLQFNLELLEVFRDICIGLAHIHSKGKNHSSEYAIFWGKCSGYSTLL